MNKKSHNTAILVVAIGLFSLNFTPVFAQQMLIQVLGGGYRLSGPSEIIFTPVMAGFDTTNSDVSIRDMTPGYIAVEDQNGGAEFQIQIEASSPLTHTTLPGNTIPLENFLVKNISGTGNDIDTLHGRSDGLVLESTLHDFFQDAPTNSISNNLGETRVLAIGTGQQPGEWKIYPGLRIQIPAATAIGLYETTLTFTII